jgi:hypothetical protein
MISTRGTGRTQVRLLAAALCVAWLAGAAPGSFARSNGLGNGNETDAAAPAGAQSAPGTGGVGGSPVVASVASTLAFQGLLTDSLGVPIEGSVSLALAIYDVASGGVALWSETQAGVVVIHGIFHLSLGSVSAFPSNLFSATPRYLAIRVNGGAELAPRTPLQSSPYALQARNSDLLENEGGAAFLHAVGDTATGVIELQGGVRALQLGGATEVVNSTTGVLARRYFFDAGGTSWAGVQATLLLSFNGSGTPGSGGAGSAVVAYGGATIDSIAIPAGGGRPWTYRVPVALADGGVLDVTMRANSGVSPVYVRSIALEAGEPAAAPQWSESGSDVYRLSGNVGVGTATPGARLQVEGDLRVGSPATTGRVDVYMSPASVPVAQLVNYLGSGGQLQLNDEGGRPTVIAEPDASAGGGGYVIAYRDSSFDPGLQVDGNYSGTHDPRVSITGAARSVTFSMNASGDASVALPGDAISAPEVLDEPGVASNNFDGFIDIGTAAVSVLSCTITPPAAGYVVAMAGTTVVPHHVTGSSSGGFGALNTFPTGIVTSVAVDAFIAAGAPSGDYYLPFQTTRTFPVSAGAPVTIYLNFAQLGLTDSWIRNPYMTLLFVPTAYGTTTLAGAADDHPAGDTPSAPPDAAQLSEERQTSIAANEARIERELAEMRARFADLERELMSERQAP